MSQLACLLADHMVLEGFSHIRTGISILRIPVVVARRGVDPDTSFVCLNQLVQNSVRVSLPAQTHIDDRAAEVERVVLIIRILSLISVMFVADVDDGLRDLGGLGTSALVVGDLDVDQVGVGGNAPGFCADDAGDASRGRRKLAKKEGWLADEVEEALTVFRDHICRHRRLGQEHTERHHSTPRPRNCSPVPGRPYA